MPAVDGLEMDAAYLKEHGIAMLPGFSEPYHGRPLKLGEIGCFMSHYNIWQVNTIKLCYFYISRLFPIKFAKL